MSAGSDLCPVGSVSGGIRFVILAHLSDLHLGFQAYESTESGGNVRERDVARAFQEARAEIVRLRPDAVLVAGDVFDGPEPTARALVTLARGLEKLRSALPETPVLMVAGARDTPRAWGDPGALAALDTFSNVEAATGTPRSVWILDGRVHVFLLPHRSVLRRPYPEVRPDPRARWNVLVTHGEVCLETGGEASDCEGTERGREGAAPPPPLEIDESEWDYVALGSRHGFEELAPGIVYSGSLERVGPEPWREAHRSKGFVVSDLETGTTEFREVGGRPVVALAPIRWDPERPERLNERIREVGAEVPGGMEGKIVRLRLEGMTRRALEALDGTLLSALRGEAMHLAVEALEEAEAVAGTAPSSLLERVVRHLEEEGSEREALEEAARTLLGDAS